MTITIELELDRIVAQPHRVLITVVNSSSREIALALPRLGQPLFDGNYFRFNTNFATYRGMTVKRQPYEQSECTVILSGGQSTFAVNLDDIYLLPSTGPLSVRYRAAHPLHIGSPMSIIESDELVLRE